MKAAAYIRVSSKGQHLDLQRHAIEKAAAERGDTLDLVEEKRSGAQLARPALDELRQQVRIGAVKRLYVYRLDRLTRSGIRDTFELVEELRRHGCDLVTCSDGFDLSGPLAEPLLAFMAWAAKMENHARRERQAAARERIEKAGGAWGRPRAITAEKMSLVLTMFNAGTKIREIARALEIPRTTLSRALQGMRPLAR